MGLLNILQNVSDLARDLVAIDSRSEQSNLFAIERCVDYLKGFDVERIDFVDERGTQKRVVAARRGEKPCLALCGHIDTVSDVGWTEDPWSARIDNGILYGLGATDMKGAIASMLVAAATVPRGVPVMVLLTTDEETTHAGAKVLIDRGVMAQSGDVRAIVIGEPTGMAPIRGHRANIIFTVTASGVQAHSATGLGLNANWALLDFLDGMRSLRDRLLTDPTLQDAAYEPKVCGFNLVIENPPISVSATVPRAVARLQFRYSAAIDPAAIADIVRDRAAKAQIRLEEKWLGRPLHLPANHELVLAAESASSRVAGTQPFNTDACQLQALAPCIIMGPGDISAAHQPGEMVRLADLEAAVPIYVELAERVAQLPGSAPL